MSTTLFTARNFTRAARKAPHHAAAAAPAVAGQATMVVPAGVGQARTAALTALGVLVPGEVIAASTALSGALAAKAHQNGSSTWLHLGLARVLVLLLAIVGIPILFRTGAGSWWANGFRGFVLLLLTILSFGIWLAIQPLSVYQGWFSLDAGEIAAIGLVGGVLIGGLAGVLGWQQAAREDA